MQLELPVRWNETDIEKSKLRELTEGEDVEKVTKYSYGKLLISVDEIGPYYDIDADNTMINDKLGKVYCITIPINQFKKIMTEITGKAIMTIQVREENIPSGPSRNSRNNSKRPPISPQEDTDDNILL